MRSEFVEPFDTQVDPSKGPTKLKGHVLDTLFSEHEAAIADLRRSDSVFDEICRDFLLLSQEHLSMSAEPGSKSYEFTRDVLESLDGLRDEIIQSLKRAGKL